MTGSSCQYEIQKGRFWEYCMAEGRQGSGMRGSTGSDSERKFAPEKRKSRETPPDLVVLVFSFNLREQGQFAHLHARSAVVHGGNRYRACLYRHWPDCWAGPFHGPVHHLRRTSHVTSTRCCLITGRRYHHHGKEEEKEKVQEVGQVQGRTQCQTSHRRRRAWSAGVAY